MICKVWVGSGGGGLAKIDILAITIFPPKIGKIVEEIDILETEGR